MKSFWGWKGVLMYNGDRSRGGAVRGKSKVCGKWENSSKCYEKWYLYYLGKRSDFVCYKDGRCFEGR